MSTYSVYSSTLSPSRLSSYTPSKYSGSSYSSTSSYLYKPPLSTTSYRSTLPVSSYLGSSYYSSTGSRRNSTNNFYSSTIRNTSNLNSSYLSGSRNTSSLSTNYLPSSSSTNNLRNYYSTSTNETPIRRNSSIDLILYRPDESKPSTSFASSSAIVTRKADTAAKKAGLINIGNTCYMNSVVQCLAHTQRLLEYCLNGEYKIHLNFDSNYKGQLIKAFADVVHDLKNSSQPFGLYDLKKEVEKVCPMFRGESQHDAQEFLRYLLQGLHEDIKKKSYSSISDPSDFNSEYSLIVDQFAGQLKSTLQCLVCKHKSIKKDPFWDLSIPIPENYSSCSLYNCFSLFSQAEVLDEGNKAFCDVCQKRTKSSKKMEVEKFPKVLVIHLKRFSDCLSERKVNTYVNCPLHIKDLSNISSRNCSNNYLLYAVIDHKGSTSGGHYVAKCKDFKTQEWHEYNDIRVGNVDEIITRHAYLLFYMLD